MCRKETEEDEEKCVVAGGRWMESGEEEKQGMNSVGLRRETKASDSDTRLIHYRKWTIVENAAQLNIKKAFLP